MLVICDKNKIEYCICCVPVLCVFFLFIIFVWVDILIVNRDLNLSCYFCFNNRANQNTAIMIERQCFD